ncbi:MAG: hypothetical protein IJX65_04300 [Alistipes sp.]|nr:hypothetical protein [Alistipes sp.]
MYTLQLTTSYAENWRYNIMVTLSLRNEAGEQTGYHSVEDSPLPIDSNSDHAPEGWLRRRHVSLNFESCHSVRFYIYLLPNSLPPTTTLAGVATTFPLQVRILKGEEELFSDKLNVNCFGGCGKEYIKNL